MLDVTDMGWGCSSVEKYNSLLVNLLLSMSKDLSLTSSVHQKERRHEMSRGAETGDQRQGESRLRPSGSETGMHDKLSCLDIVMLPGINAIP